jgi:hypothetical protein
MVSYVLIIHGYLPTYLVVPQMLNQLTYLHDDHLHFPTYIVITYLSYLVVTKVLYQLTYLPTYMVTTYLSYHNSYLGR